MFQTQVAFAFECTRATPIDVSTKHLVSGDRDSLLELPPASGSQ